MTAPATAFPRKRIIGLFTELLAVGGVQQAGRLTSMAFSDIARECDYPCQYLSLNDPGGMHCLPSSEGIRFRGFGRNKSAFAFAALRIAFRARDGGLVVAGHPNLGPIAAWMQRLRPSLRIIVMSHGIEVWEPLAAHRRKALHRADCVLAPSSYTAIRLTEMQGVPPAKVRRLPWPIDSAFLQFVREPQKLQLPVGFPSGRTVLTVGRWAANERYKGADELIHAIAALKLTTPDIQLVAVGTGDDLPRLRAIAAELYVDDHVHFLEKLSNEELAASYGHADVFALPSTGEGFGLVFLEAMAFGKPVVGVAAGGITDIVRDGKNGFLVPPGDAQRLTEALRMLLDDAPLRARFGAAASEMVKQQYSFEAFRSQLAQIVSDVGNKANRT